MKKNIITLTDSYKFGHWKMFENKDKEKQVEGISSYFESRNGAQFPTTVSFGLQGLAKEHLVGKVVTQEKLDRAMDLSGAHLGNRRALNYRMWKHIIDNYDGRLPVEMWSIPEGTEVEESNALTIVKCEDKIVAPLVNHLETVLTNVWYPSSVATLSKYIKKDLITWGEKTCDNLNHIPYQVHDFAMRSVKSPEAGGFGGSGHLLNFLGTDTVSAIEYLNQYYNSGYEGVAYSVFATEHNTMMYLGPEGEEYLVGKALDENPTDIVSIVADTFNIYNFVENIVGKTYKQRILDREGVFVVRPDSVTPDHPTKKEITLWILEQLWKDFGGHENTKGYRVLNDKIRVLYGDGLTQAEINEILDYVAKAGFASCNLVFGLGSGLLDKSLHRDTQRFAYKSSAMKINGEWVGVAKNPLGSNKRSKKGLLKVVKTDEGYKTLTQYNEGFDKAKCELVKVFSNGKLTKDYTLQEIRENAEF